MNPVLAAAIEALQQADGELRRIAKALDKANSDIVGAEQHLARLRNNEIELNKTLSDLAAQVALARQTIDSAPAVHAEALRGGREEADKVLNAARAAAQKVIDEAKFSAANLVNEAKAKIEALGKDHAEAEAKLKETQGRLDEANTRIAALKKQAATFAGG